MLEHHDPLRAVNPASPAQTEPLLNVYAAQNSAEGSNSNALLEDYLDQVFAPLVGTMPYAKRQEERAEMRSHLLNLAAAHQELGSAPEEALLLALRQFGKPRMLARRWKDTWQETRNSVRPAVRFAIPLFAAWGATFCFLVLAADRIQNWIDSTGDRRLNEFIGFAVIYYCFLGPFVCGLMTGLRKKARPILGSLLAMAITIPVTVLAAETLEIVTHEGKPSLMEAAAGFLFGAFAGGLAIPLVCFGAAVGKWFRSRRSRALVR